MPQAPDPPPLKPCFVCADGTALIRSMTLPAGPPADLADAVPICPDCSAAWTSALTLAAATTTKRPHAKD